MARGSNSNTVIDIASRTSADEILYGAVAASSQSSRENRLQAAADDITAALNEEDWSEAVSVLEHTRDDLDTDPVRLQAVMEIFSEHLPFEHAHDLTTSFYDRKLDAERAAEELRQAFIDGDDLGELRLGLPLAFLERERSGVIGEELARRVVEFPDRVDDFPMLSMMTKDQAIQVLDEAHQHGPAWEQAFLGLSENILDHQCERDWYRSPAQGLHQVLNGDDLRVRWFKRSHVLHLFTDKGGNVALCGTKIKEDAYAQHDWRYADKGDWKRVADGDTADDLDGVRLCKKCAALGHDHPSVSTDPDPDFYDPQSFQEMRAEATIRAREYLEGESEPDYAGFEESLTDFESKLTYQLATTRLTEMMIADPERAWEALLGRKYFELEAPVPQMSAEQAEQLIENINGTYVDRSRYRGKSQGKAFETCKQLQVEQGLRQSDPVKEETVNDWYRWLRGSDNETGKLTDEAHLFLPDLPEGSTSSIFTATPACGAKLTMPERGRARKRPTHRCPECEACKAAGQTRSRRS